MMFRDNLKDEIYFRNYIDSAEKGIPKFIEGIKIGRVAEARIPIIKRTIGGMRLRIIIAKYSLGTELSEIEKEFKSLLKDFSDYWQEGKVLFKLNGKEIKQYLDYHDMLWMLSLSCLFKCPQNDFENIANLIDRDGVKDVLLEFFLKSNLPTRNFNGIESYENGWDLYQSLRKSIGEELDITQRQDLINDYLKNEWKKEHKRSLPSKRDRHSTYHGVWSFESAAIVCLLNLDDAKFRDHPHYPKEMVDYYRG